MRKTQNNRKLWLLAGFVCVAACSGDTEGGGGGGSGGNTCCMDTGGTGGTTSPPSCKEIPIPEGFPKALVSFGKRTVTSSGAGAPMLVDGKFRSAGAWRAGRQLPSWVAIEVGGGISELLLFWTASANTDHPEIRYGAPAAYRIQTSADSTNGNDGHWNTAKEVSDNKVRTRTHRIPFENQRWLRFVVLSDEGTENDGVQIDEIELLDNTDGKADVWFFLGDSITAGAFTREASQNPAFATWLWATDSNHYPIQMNGGYGGDTARNPAAWGGNRQHSLLRLRQALNENDGIRVVTLALGTNDFGAMEEYRSAMREMIREVQSRGKTAIVPRIPWARGRSETTQEAMNKVVDELTQEFGLPKGPDLYAHFKANPNQLRDDLHPNAAGNQAMNCLWAEAAQAVPKP